MLHFPCIEDQRAFAPLFFASATLLFCPCDHRNSYTLISMAAAVALGYQDKRISKTGILSLAIYAGVLAVYQQSGDQSSGLFACALALLVMRHHVPGFKNQVRLQEKKIKPNSTACTVWWNLDKTLFGLLTIIFLTQQDHIQDYQTAMMGGVATVAVAMAAAVGLDYLRPQLTIPHYSDTRDWLLSNGLSVCMAEGAVFRLLLPAVLTTLCGSRLCAASLSTVLYGVTNIPTGGKPYALLAGVAGLGCQWVFEKTQSLCASVWVHFVLNAVHFVGFTYPTYEAAKALSV